jgi:hypothetical protein
MYWFAAAKTCLPWRYLATASLFMIPAFSCHVTLLPPYGCCSSPVAYRPIAISSSPRWHVCNICDCWLQCSFWSQQCLPFTPHGLDLALLFPNFSLLRAAHLKLHTSFVGRPPSMCFCDQPAISSHRYRHHPWGLDQCSRFSLIGGPGTLPCKDIHRLKGSFQQYRCDYILLSRCYFTVALHTGGWMQSRPRTQQWRLLISQS